MNAFNTLTIYRSSAGSGKTYTLVKEYLKVALGYPPAFKQILAITFTNKATDEMKSRIVKTLVDFTGGRHSELKEELKAVLNLNEENFNSNAMHLLRLILHHYSDFGVCTIDSFFNKVLRSLSKEIGLPLKFDTELNQDTVIREITGRLLLEAGKDSRLTAWLEDFIFSKMTEDKGWNIERELHLIAKELFKEDFKSRHNPEENITAEFIKELHSIKHNFESAMKSFGSNFLKEIGQHNLGTDDFSYGKSGVAGYFDKIRMKISPDGYEPGKRAIAAHTDPEKWVSKSSKKKEQILELVEGTLRYFLEDVIKHYERNGKDYVTATEVLKLIYVAGIINKLYEKLKAYRDENDVLLISDINLLLKDFISGSDAPFIYEKTGNRYRHFMIDEFQDTSAFQWSNMLPLVENSLAGGSSAMMVGDAKQSVYRWRGGKMQLLLNGIQKDLRQYASITSIENLKTNYRSKKEIVDFNNSFFSNAAAQLNSPEISEGIKSDMAIAYKIEEVEQNISQKNKEGGYVEFIFYDAKNQADSQNNSIHKNDIALNRLLITLNRLVEQGYELKDICILVRTNTQGNDIAKFLFENGYKKIVSSESLLISNAPQIIFLVNLMKLLNDPEDKIARGECINYYLTYIKNETHQVGHDIFKIVNDSKLFYAALPVNFSDYFSRLKKLPLFELSEQLSEIFELNKQPDAYLQRFQDLILEYLEKNPSSLSVFIQWWEENKESDKISVIVPSNENAVCIMSIHKSKGLQFPVVIIPFPDWELKPKSSNILWVHSNKNPYSGYSLLPVNTTGALEKTFFAEEYNAELQLTLIDNLNLLYVAFTRAEERLYLFCPDVKTEKINKASNLICSVFESNEKWKGKITIINGCRKFASGIESAKEKSTRQKVIDKTSFEEPEIISLKNYHSTPWQNKLVLAVNKNKISIEDEENIFTKSDFGVLVHNILSKIIYSGDAEKVVQELSSDEMISEQQSEEIKNIITDVLKICEPYKWFSDGWKIKTESQLLLPDGSVIRPDRVMIRGKDAVLLDYKTGEADSLHEKQLHTYATILMDSGYEKVEKYLLYLIPVKLLKIE